MAKSSPKIVLAYSGGLDTSVIVRWLKESRGYEVIALYAEVGQGRDAEAVRRKALASGAGKVYIVDLRQEYAEDFCLKALQAGAVYEGGYFLSAALSRPLIAKHLVEVARAEGAQAVAHGSTGKGNDQVRFEASVMALAPELGIVAPLREWEFGSRQEEIEYAQKYGIPVEATKEKPYSIDVNLWGASIECGVLEDPWQEPPADVYFLTVAPEKAPIEAEYLEVEFVQGVPVALNGRRLGLVELIQQANAIGGRHGVGRSDLVENRLVGIKSREIYEAPGAAILHTAYRELERLVLDRESQHFKELLSAKYAELIYYGLWYSPLREALDAFFTCQRQWVSGKVRLRLYRGMCQVVGRLSEASLYDFKLATYNGQDAFDHRLGTGFCRIWGLPLKVAGQRRRRQEKGSYDKESC